MSSAPTYLFAGSLRREYILPPDSPPRYDLPGGDLLYAACAAAIWAHNIGLIGRVGEDYPRRWLLDLQQRRFDTRGITIRPGKIDLRWFRAYNRQGQPQPGAPMAEFARRGLAYPKALLGYTPQNNNYFFRTPEELNTLPADYLNARAAHLCPAPLALQTHLLGLLKRGSLNTISLMLPPEAIRPGGLDVLHSLARSVLALIVREESLRQIFFGQTNRLEDMLDALSVEGSEFIVVLRQRKSAILLDVPGRKRWEVSAYPTRLVDPTGYEDAFCGGFLAGFRQTYDGLEGLLHGLTAASFAQEGSGPFYLLDVLPGLPQARLDALHTQIKRL